VSPDSQPEAAATRPTAQSELYSFALQLIQYEIQRLWTIFGFFLLAETVLLAAIAQVFDSEQPVLVYAGCVVGLLLILPWWATFENTRRFYLLRLQQAKALEPGVATFLTEGHVLATEGLARGVEMGFFLRTMRPQRSGWFLMLVFLLTFVGMALLKTLG
jgi:hypothetical protein